jgi:hypothetical protein
VRTSQTSVLGPVTASKLRICRRGQSPLVIFEAPWTAATVLRRMVAPSMATPRRDSQLVTYHFLRAPFRPPLGLPLPRTRRAALALCHVCAAP